MKMNSDLTKTLLGIAAQTAFDKITNNAATTGQATPQDSAKGAGAGPIPEKTDGLAGARLKHAPDSQPQEPFAQMLKGIGTQVTAAVTEGLSRQMDQKVVETLHKAEIVVERQRLAALSEIQAVLELERSKAMEELRQTAASVSNKIIVSATFLGSSLLMVALALFLQK